MARFTTTPCYKRERAALEWLKRPKTSTQIADLLGLTPNHGAALCRRLWLRGKAERTGTRKQYVYTRAANDGT
jgi:DNA-binding CsgD family transcriptional regulator